MCTVNTQGAVYQSNSAPDNKITLIILISRGFETRGWELLGLLEGSQGKLHGGFAGITFRTTAENQLAKGAQHTEEAGIQEVVTGTLPCQLNGCLPAC